MFFSWSRHSTQNALLDISFGVALSWLSGTWTVSGVVVFFFYFVVSALPSSVWEAYRARHSSGLAGVAPVFGLFVLSVSVLPICIIICLALLP